MDEVLSEGHHISTLVFQLREHSIEWRTIGMHLGFRTGELDIIGDRSVRNSEGAGGSLRIMLAKWMQWISGDSRGSKQVATLRALKDAVRKAGYGRTADLLSVTTRESTNNESSTERNGLVEGPVPKRPRLE